MIHFGAAAIGAAEKSAAAAVLEDGFLTRGERSREMERTLRGITGQECHVVSSGTAALHLALLAAGVATGDEVIVPATSFVATINAVKYCGATPVVVDVDPVSWTIDCEQAIAAVTPRTKAIIPVNLYGCPPADFTAWRDSHYCATGRRVWIIEDAAEGLGAMRGGLPAVGDLTTYSFYGSKTCTTGEGGAVGWREADALAGRRVRHLAAQAQTSRRYHHDTVGYNYRMTDLQAAVGNVQLGRLGEFLRSRREVFDWYEDRLPPGFRSQRTPADCVHGLWAFAVLNQNIDADRVIAGLAAAGIESRPVFPPFEPKPRARLLNKCGLVLPTHCLLSETDVARVCSALRDSCA